MKVFVGIDMSLRSPGVALIRPGDTAIYLMGFQQRKSDKEIINHKVVGPTETVVITRCSYPVDVKDRWFRSEFVVNRIIEWIKGYIEPTDDVHVYIENYALGMVGSSSVSTLCELGGILRISLYRLKWTFSEMSPGTVKKYFAGNGRASKLDMVAAYHVKYPRFTDVMKVRDGQHPQEDMIDALGIVLAGMYAKVIPKRKKKSRKRKPKK